MTRSVAEWIAKSDDAPVPDRVRLRVFFRADGRCQKCTRAIASGETWGCDHIVALANGGSNRESNLQCLCRWCHSKKTAIDVGLKSKTYSRSKKHHGIKKRKRTIAGRKFNGDPIPSRIR